MKKVFFLLGGILFFQSCSISDDGSNIDPKYAGNNAVNIRFYSKTDSSLIQVDNSGFTSFTLKEKNHNSEILKVSKSINDYIFLRSSTLYSFAVLPLNLDAGSSTFIMFRNGGSDTVIVKDYSPKNVYVDKDTGYKVTFEKPKQFYASFKNQRPIQYDKVNQVFYLEIFL